MSAPPAWLSAGVVCVTQAEPPVSPGLCESPADSASRGSWPGSGRATSIPIMMSVEKDLLFAAASLSTALGSCWPHLGTCAIVLQ